MQHKLNFYVTLNRFELRVFFLFTYLKVIFQVSKLTHKFFVYAYTFPKKISAMWNANSLV